MKPLPTLALALCFACACSTPSTPVRAPDASASSVDASVSPFADAGPVDLAQPLTAAQLRDPESCKGCHPIHYREWSSSMHAYSALDPVFVAMNKRGQRETGGALGDFCVKCHAPMAVYDKLTTDGLNLDKLADKRRGVSCYYCHNAVSVEADHNAQLTLTNDTTMRAAIDSPIDARAHLTGTSELYNPDGRARNAMCGGCHDIVTQRGVHLERTYEEFLNGFFSFAPSDAEPTLESCESCHMSNRKALAAVAPAGAPERAIHEHLWPGVDLPLVDFPNRTALRSAIENCQLGIASIQFFTLTAAPPNLFTVSLETNAGHNQPSGAAHDRRMWVELLAYDDDGQLIGPMSSGNIGDGELEEKAPADPRHDPQLWLFRDRIFGADGAPVHMFWDAAPSNEHPSGLESNTLPVRSKTLDIGGHATQKQYVIAGRDGTGTPARITARLRMRPIGIDVLQDLVDSGDLDPKYLAQMQTLTFGAQLEWKREDGFMNTISAAPVSDCASYLCMLDPDRPECAATGK